MPHHLPTPRLGRAAAVLAATFAAGAVAAPQASALSVDRSLFNGKQTVLITADDTTDVVNQLTVTPSDDELIITDAKATFDAVGAGCTKLDAHNVSCPAAGTGALRVNLGDGDDSFFGTQLAIATAVWGDAGTDTIFTGSGPDYIADGNFSVNLDHHDLYSAGGGNDEFRVAAYGNDVVSGGEGIDTADFSGSNAAVTVSLDGVANDGIGATKKSNVSVEHVVGTSAGDTLKGSGAANKLSGGPGDDKLYGEGGVDTLSGGDNDDVLAGGAAGDTITGGAGRDGVDYSLAGTGVNVSLDLVANDGVANEKDNVWRDVEEIKGSAFADTLVAWAANNTLDGGGGNDKLDGANGTDVLLGGADDDVIVDGPGGQYDKGDVITPGTGYDTIDYSARTKGVRYQGGDAFANEGENGEGDKATEPVEHVIGGSGNDELSGSNGNDLLEGRGGDDRLQDWKGDDKLDGGEGADLVSFSGSSAPVVASLDGVINDGFDANLDGAADEKNELIAIEGLEGGGGPDTLTGDSEPNRLEGGHGDDVIQARGGDDLLIGGEGADDLMGSAGTDTVSYTERLVGIVTTFGDGFNDGTDANGDGVSEEKDAIRSTVENVIGGQGKDKLTGNWVANVLDGFSGDDTITGGDGADTLIGGGDNDKLHGKGDATADSLDCGLNTDTATADAGLDTAKDCETVG